MAIPPTLRVLDLMKRDISEKHAALTLDHHLSASDKAKAFAKELEFEIDYHRISMIHIPNLTTVFFKGKNENAYKRDSKYFPAYIPIDVAFVLVLEAFERDKAAVEAAWIAVRDEANAQLQEFAAERAVAMKIEDV